MMGICADRLLATCRKPSLSLFQTVFAENFNQTWTGTQLDPMPTAGYLPTFQGTSISISGGKATFNHAEWYFWVQYSGYIWEHSDDYVIEYVFDGAQLPPFVILSTASPSAARVVNVSGLSIAPAQQNNHFAFGVQDGADVAWLNGSAINPAAAGVAIQRVNPTSGFTSIGTIENPYWDGVISALRMTKGNRYGNVPTITVPTGDLL